MVVGVKSSPIATMPHAPLVKIVIALQVEVVPPELSVLIFEALGATSHTDESTPRYCLKIMLLRFEVPSVNAYAEGSLLPHTR